jgi:hypothetical protein
LIGYIAAYKAHRRGQSVKETVQTATAATPTASKAKPEVHVDEQVEATETEIRHIGTLMRRYAAAVEVQSGTKADVNILLLSTRLCRALGVGIAVACKSAKDRTSMSVTYEQADILARAHRLPRKYVLPVANRMRTQGVRRTNCFHNIGVPLFAFNGFQLQCLPRIYRPPEHVAGAKKS